MRKLAMLAAASIAAVVATPAAAQITNEDASLRNGTGVHSDGAATAHEVIGDFGAHGPTIVHFTADTNGPGDLVVMSGGGGEADWTGPEINVGPPHNDFYNLLSGDIFLDGHAGMEWIELGLTAANHNGTIDFTLSDALGGTVSFNDLAMGNGDTHFGFLGLNGHAITNLHWSMDSTAESPNAITIIKQVRLDLALAPTPQGSVPEPATWATMLLGFGVTGAAMRRSRRRKSLISQFA